MRDSEQKRLNALASYDILDTPAEESFDRITRITRELFHAPMSTIAFIDGHRQWFKSRQGVAKSETERAPALCNVTIQQRRPLIIEDTLADERFRENPFVVGDPRIRFYAGVPLTTPEGANIGTLCVMDTKPRHFGAEQVALLNDMAQLILTGLELRALATTDALTGILSRRAFIAEAERAIAIATRHRVNLSCITFDLDHFKSINDGFGHQTGDSVLTTMAQTCATILRKSDVFGRIGGEEFAIAMPHTGPVPAMEVAEKLRSAVARQVFTGPTGERMEVTASFGVASVDRSTTDFRALLEHADAALYEAKRAGRNRCNEWNPPRIAMEPVNKRRVLKAGKISFNLGHSAIDCTVRTLSDTGAGLDVVSSAGVPDAFKLLIESDDKSLGCRVTSKQNRHIEVEFA